MPWILAGSLVLMLTALTSLFVFNARALRRDMNRRFAELRTRLEDEATAVLDEFIRQNRSA
jgi:hypothetical protein